MRPRIYVGGLGVITVAAGLLLWQAQRASDDLAAQVTRLSRQNADLRYELKQASTQAADIGRRAVELDSQLGSAKSRTTATEAKNQQLARELTAREQREVALMAELAELRQQAPASAPEPAVLPTLILTPAPTAKPASQVEPAALPPAVDIEPYRRRIAELEAQLVDLLTRTLAALPPEATPVPTAAPVPHQVVRVGPADTFVVLDYGADHGARAAAVVRLQRGTSELARVQISDIRPRFSLARVLPGTLKGQLQTGDLVVFTQ